MLGQYVDVAKQTKSNKDDSLAAELNKTQHRQRTYINAVQRYHHLHNRYEKAKRNGNRHKARRTARKLNHLQSTISTIDNGLTRNYRNVSNSTDTNLHRNTRSVHRVTQNITNQQVAIRQSEFTPTQLDNITTQRRTSYLNPLTVTGKLLARNGTTLANRTIRLRLTPNRTVSTTTSADGTFSISARPRAVHLGKQSFDLRYVPATTSAYLGANATASSVVSQTNAAVTLQRSSKASSFGKRVTARGSVRAYGRTVSNVPVTLFVGGTKIATTTTNSGGTFRFHSKLPFNTSAGNRRLRVQLPFHRQALKRAKATATIRIHKTPTSVTLAGNVTQGHNVTVRGNVTTKDGRAVSNRTVAILANGRRIGIAHTDRNGTYRSQLQVPPRVVKNRSNNTVALVAKYRNGGTNLAESRAKTTVTFPGTESLLAQYSLPLVVGGVLVGLLLVAVGLYVWRTRRDSGDGSPTQLEQTEAEDADDEFPIRPEQPETEDSVDEPTPSTDTDRLLLDQANTALADGNPNRAT